jgi:hypothetical protein
MVPSTFPYSIHRPQSEDQDLPPNDKLLGAALDQSNTIIKRPTRSSTSSSTANTSVSLSESLDAIQSGLQAIQSSFRITDDLLQRAQPLLQVSHYQHPISSLKLST